MDNTAEWISLSDESVLVAEEMCLAKVSANSTPWPSQRFWMSKKAADDVQNIAGYKRDGKHWLISCTLLFIKQLTCFCYSAICGVLQRHRR